uniref:UDP-glucuronic acid decarboxylase 1 n=1 Tax=Ditylenchus dipsaci TaxID=166011 RepID=A0A915CTC3_9BILA
MTSMSFVALVLFASSLALMVFLNSRLFSMTGQLTKDIGRSLTNSDDVSKLKRDISDLQEQLLRLKHLISIRPEKNSNAISSYPNVKFRNEETRKRILITGGAGFVGSHLLDRLMLDGHEVIALDNFFTGRKRNVEQWIGHPNFELVHHDVVNPYYSEVDQIYHLASPASPPHYMYNPVKTLKTNAIGTINLLGLARYVAGSKSDVIYMPKLQDDPQQRRPDIRRAYELLGWKPQVSMHDGLKLTIEYFSQELEYEKLKSANEHKDNN